MKNKDNRLECSSEKKMKIKESLMKTRLKRSNQIVKVFECKIVEKRLNKKQKEELEMLFIEGKWFYNHVLNLHKDIELGKINTTNIKQIDKFNKDKQKETVSLDYLSAA